MPLYTPAAEVTSNVTEYMFAFPGGDIGTWHADDGTPLDTYTSGSGTTYTSSVTQPGPSGNSLKIESTSGNGDYFCTPVFPVQPGDVIEWVLSFGNPLPTTQGPVYLDSFYPLYWATADPSWATPYTDYGSNGFSKAGATLVRNYANSSPGVFPGSAIVPASRVQSSLEFYCLSDGDDASYIFYVQGCFVRVTTPPEIT